MIDFSSLCFRSADSTIRLWSVSESTIEGESLDTNAERVLEHSHPASGGNDVVYTDWRV